MSATSHPIARRLDRLGDSELALLALVMGLPLIDGIFPALVLAGALDDPLGAVQVGLLIFGGSATVAVILAEMDGTPREGMRIVLIVGVPLIVVAALQAAIAPSIASVLDLVVFERFAALVILAIAAKTASATIGEYLPSPGVIVALGLLASLDPSGAEFVVLEDPSLVANATLAAVVGVAFALGVAAFGPTLRTHVDVDRFRFGSALALGLLPLSLLGMGFGHAPLAVLAVAALFAFDPTSDSDSFDSSSDSDSFGSSSGSDSFDSSSDSDSFGSSSGSAAFDRSSDSDAFESGGRPDGTEPRATDPNRTPPSIVPDDRGFSNSSRTPRPSADGGVRRWLTASLFDGQHPGSVSPMPTTDGGCSDSGSESPADHHDRSIDECRTGTDGTGGTEFDEPGDPFGR